jgi:integrase
VATLPLPPHLPLNEGVADGDRDATCSRQRPPVHPRDKAGRESWHGKWYVDGRQVDRGGEGEKQDVVHAGTFALYLAAAMTGLRQGELVALRWVDVDWKAGRIRVRRNYTRQEFGTLKSKRSSRSVPMTKRVVGSLKSHLERTAYSGDDDLAFCHPGHPLDASKLRKRYKDALKRAGVRAVRFHDLRHTFGTRCAVSLVVASLV